MELVSRARKTLPMGVSLGLGETTNRRVGFLVAEGVRIAIAGILQFSNFPHTAAICARFLCALPNSQLAAVSFPTRRARQLKSARVRYLVLLVKFLQTPLVTSRPAGVS